MASGHGVVPQDPFFLDILTDQPDSILFCTDTRIYLRPEKIHPTQHGILIGDQGSFIAIPFLVSDRTGCYLLTGSRPSAEYTGYWVCWNEECSNYGKVWRSKSQYCSLCKKPGQPS